MADHHNARDDSDRNTYRHKLGRPLTEGSAAAMQWGPEYRDFHERAWEEATRVVNPHGAVFVLNCKNHIRKGRVEDVTAWHVGALGRLGWDMIDWIEVPVQGNRQGDNGEARVECEDVVVFVR